MRINGQEINSSNYQQQTTRELERTLYFCESGRWITDKTEAAKLIPLLKEELNERYILEGRIQSNESGRNKKIKLN